MGQRGKPERNRDLVDKFANGWTYAQLQEHFGISSSRVADIIAQDRAKRPPRERAEIIAQHQHQLEHLRTRAEEIAHAEPAPVMNAGAPVPILDENGQPTGRFAVDHTTALKAMGAIVQLQAREARLLGLDQPTQVGVDTTMRVIVEGVDTNDL